MQVRCMNRPKKVVVSHTFDAETRSAHHQSAHSKTTKVDNMEIKKWYFAANERALKQCFYQIEIAVKSALKNTPLKPYCLFVGEETDLLARLREMGVEIIHHESSFKEDLKIGYGEKYKIFSGHWLRADIPLIEQSEEFILYTDIDVMFMRWPEYLQEPRIFSAAPEMDAKNLTHFNSGVMVMNISGMRSVHEEFSAAIRNRLNNEFKYPAHDQKSFNDFFAGEYDHLDIRMNWKPYWGRNDEAAIIHFHGPKPHNISSFEAGDTENIKKGLVTLWKKNPEGYKFYLNEARQYSETVGVF